MLGEAGVSCRLRLVLEWRVEVRPDFCWGPGVVLESESESK